MWYGIDFPETGNTPLSHYPSLFSICQFPHHFLCLLIFYLSANVDLTPRFMLTRVRL